MMAEEKNGGSDGTKSAPPGTTAGPKTAVRILFPETWIWENETIGPDGVVKFEEKAPDTITSWVASAFAVHPEFGLGVSPITANLTVFRPFFISMTLPYSIRHGEVFGLKATVFNYLNTSLSVKVTLKKSTWFNVQDDKKVKQNTDVVKTIMVEENDAATVYFWIIAVKLGEMPIEVLAQGGTASDGERRTVLVKPEGIEQEYSISLLIDNSKKNRPVQKTWKLSLPTNDLVEGSAIVEVTVIGDVIGASLEGIDKLISMPSGCGEQLMLSIAPNVYVLKCLRATKSLTPAVETKCRKYILSGYQAELTYQRLDGSFSAFGENDPSGSMWLSAYVIATFFQARNDIPVEDSKLALTINWIVHNQNANGSFTEPPNGRIIHTDMQGGASKGVTLTAYVLVSLISNQDNSVTDKTVLKGSVSRAVKYLEGQLSSLNDSYSLCVVSYALVLAKSPKAPLALSMRDARAIKKNDQIHWEKVDPTVPATPNSFVPPFPQAHALDIEMTSYALLCCVLQKNASCALPMVRWILDQRNSNGGFVSTQDTVMAIQALAGFAALIYDPQSSFSLQVTASLGKSHYLFDPVTSTNMLTLQTWTSPLSSGSLSVNATGLGVALVQVNVLYNVYKLPHSNGLSLTVKPVVKDEGNTVVLTTCAKWPKDEPIGMVLETIEMPSGYGFHGYEEDDESKGAIKKLETDSQSVSVYFDTLDSVGTCIHVTMLREVYITNLKNVTVTVVEYYKPENFVTETYSLKLPDRGFCETCVD